MSLLKKYFKGLRFRTNRPSFDVGEEIRLYVTDFEDGSAIARVGDTILNLPDGSEDLVGSQVDIRIETFDASTSVGEASLIEGTDETTDESMNEPLDEATD